MTTAACDSASIDDRRVFISSSFLQLETTEASLSIY